MNDQQGGENSADWKNGDRNVQQTEGEKYLPFVADLRAPEIAVPVRPTGHKFKFLSAVF